MAELSRLEILDHFGFKRNPFKSVDFETADRARIRRIVSMAVADNAMVSVVGIRGMGKTRSVVDAARRMSLKPVVIDFPEQTRLLIGDIERTMIRELSDENPRRSKDARKPQLRRILGESARQRKVVVVIEEAHRIHSMTLRAIKSLRTLDWMGQEELFTVILIGQSDPMRKSGVSEVRLRADSVQMQGLTSSEAGDYIRTVVGDVFDDKAVGTVSRLPECRNFLELQSVLMRLMGRAMVDGRDRVTSSDVDAEFSDKKPPATRSGGLKGKHAAGNAFLKKTISNMREQSASGIREAV
ncbi:hypothetical protein DSCO28_50760 [Desulfosarcina ovata subsp. sediminis]|uniref:ORC1/DEAH AAA+ ATPase domain-containing protein n=1 Tax=Desulfosarcina ovata subsp. sediminis TaxID=885957 RepID=A0A5K7ZWM5_9BACT|nr:AAA family ATPase [Desulfosarcina ovata]BBO84510.1 hypothetical protein DSCO28_50760 [Desulfosarcina ovata subsp. sediminis]